MSNTSTSKLGESNRHHIFINRLISFYTFVGITYLLFFKSNQQCNCASFNNKLLSTHTILTTQPNITTTITDIPTLYRTPLHGSKRNLLSSNTTIRSVKRNHELIQNLYSMLPNGIVLLWYGSISTIPPGWSLCDGTNDTPDLRDKFVIGGGNLYNLNDNGGTSNIQLSINHLPTHSHDMTNILSTTHTGHTHNTGTFSFSNQNGHTHTFSDTSTSSGSHIHSCSASTANSGTHSHSCSAVTGTNGLHYHSCSATAAISGDHVHSCSAETVITGGHRHNDGDFGYLVQQRSDGCGTVLASATDCLGPAGSFDLEDSSWMKYTGDHVHSATCSTASDGAHSHGTSCSTGTDGTHSHSASCNTASVSNHKHGTSCSTVSAGSHNHSISGATSSSTSHSHTISGLSGNDGGHSHTVSGTTNSIGNSNTINILNPYYTAYYIMKIPYKFATDNPTNAPTIAPSTPPTNNPSPKPTISPTLKPSLAPTLPPSVNPSITPTLAPSSQPSIKPTSSPIILNPAVSMSPSVVPSIAPTFSVEPTFAPSLAPTSMPTGACWDAKYKWYMISSTNLNRNDMLFSGESLVSANCNYILTMKANGNLVLNGVVGKYIDPYAKDENGNFINDENKMRMYTGWETNTTIKQNSDESISVAYAKDGTLLVEEHEFFGAHEFNAIELWKSDEYIVDENELILQLSDNGCLTLNKYYGSSNTYTDHLIPIWFVCAENENDKNDNIDEELTTTSMLTTEISKNANDNNDNNDDDDILGIVLNIYNNDDKIQLLTIWNMVISFLLIVILLTCLYICIKALCRNCNCNCMKVADPQGYHTSVSPMNEEDDDELEKGIELWSVETPKNKHDGRVMVDGSFTQTNN